MTTTTHDVNDCPDPQHNAASASRIAVAMSGGVDSSVAAALLVGEGREVLGITMHLAGNASRCCSLEDADDARRVADKLGVRFFVANYTERFRREIIEGFADAYLAGRTPIPCVECNSKFKFEYLLARAAVLDASQVATGHYARLSRDAESGRRRLFRSRHRSKDQSYFLFQLKQTQLARILFPLGERSKDEVRKIARELGLATADKAESQEICFVPDGDYAAVVEEVRPEALTRDGPIVDEEGRLLGRHPGVHRFTVGQRHGLGIPQAGRRLYVQRIDAEARTLVVGGIEGLATRDARVGRVSWIAGAPPANDTRVRVQIRHRHGAVPARVEMETASRARLRFEENVSAVTPGQAAVFYDLEHDEEVLGGGWLEGVIS